MPVVQKWSEGPAARALFAAVLLAAIMLPYWWLAVQWSGQVLQSPDVQFTFSATTFLLVLIIADSAFLVRYYQLVRKRELLEKTVELRRSEDALRTANKKLNLLSGITRHDIRNQLMALKAYLQLSEDAVDKPAELAEFFAKEQKIADTIERQISFTKDYEDMGVKSPLWQNVSEIISTASKDQLPGNIRIDVKRQDLEVFADPLLVKVFYNLIENALRYGGDNLTTISLDAQEQEDGSLLMIFEDDGVGISPEDRAGLFSKGHGKHSGLGLFLSREILAITGITINENGTFGKGARFEIVIPRGNFRVIKKIQ